MIMMMIVVITIMLNLSCVVLHFFFLGWCGWNIRERVSIY